jgi:hypothetical protein
MEELRNKLENRKLTFFKELSPAMSGEEIGMKAHEIIGFELAVSVLNDFDHMKNTLLFDRFEEERELENDKDSREDKSTVVESLSSGSKRTRNRRIRSLQIRRS